ncbi:MAG: dephospho-CoA kinase [Syntrophomonadaceae bacterium]
MKTIGLTGGIASGKSTVAKALGVLGALVINADTMAHEIMLPETPAWVDVVKHFGEQVLNEDRTINRTVLGQIVFNQPEQLKLLNQIVHPRIVERFQNDLDEIRNDKPEAIVVMEVALLYESHMDRLCDEVWVVWVDRETQICRLMAREGISREDALKRIAAQMPLDEKARRADRVLDNSHSIEEAVAVATKYYKEISQTI